MKAWKLRIKIGGKLSTPLHGDTIFGHVAWGIARREGEESISEFLALFSHEPALVVSSAFPAGQVPAPMLSPSSSMLRDSGQYELLKKVKKIKYIPVSTILSGKPVSRVSFPIQDLHYEEYRQSSLHNTVDRFGAGTLEETGLYERTEYWPVHIGSTDRREPASMDIYLLSTLSKERLATVFSWAFESGYGARASTGSGQVSIEGLEEFSPPRTGSRAVALGPFVLSPGNQLGNLRADIFLRRGKLGSEFAARINPFKKPILFYSEGSTFDAPVSTDYVGTLIENVHEDKRIRHQGMAPILRFNEVVE